MEDATITIDTKDSLPTPLQGEIPEKTRSPPSTVSDSPGLKRNAPHSEATATVNDAEASGNNKRPKIVLDESSATDTNSASDVLDLAETLELKVGTQIEVQWEILKTGDDDNNNTAAETNRDDSTESTSGAINTAAGESTSSLHWWRATLLEHDGRTTESVAIRTLLYEARPDLGFPEPSREDVIFLGKDVLVTSKNADAANWETDPDSVDTMPYRRVLTQPEASTAAASDVVHFFDDDQLEEQLNGILMGALTKNQSAWNSMPAARQAVIAETIRKKKDELKEILKTEAREKGGVITPETIKDILARAF